MKTFDLKGKKIGVFGFGAEGKSLIRYFLGHEIRDLKLFDEREITTEEKKWLDENGVSYVEKKFEDGLYDIEVAFRSPGVKISRLKEILSANIEITSATELFINNCPGTVIGVTGTKGKSTTVKLIESLLKLEKIKFFSGGNIGNPAIDFLDDVDVDAYIVLELSSFQLQGLTVSPDIAVILPILSDHLNYHENIEEYIEAKSSIVKFMKDDSLIVANNQELVRRIIPDSANNCYFFSKDTEVERGCYIDLSNQAVCNFSEPRQFEGIIENANQKKVPVINVLACLTLREALGFKADMNMALDNLQKPHFRMEFVGKFDGISYFNDGASTNPISTIAGIEMMSEPFALILGGSSKGLEFSGLAQAVVKVPNLKSIYLYGQTADEILLFLNQAGYGGEVYQNKTLDEAVSAIKKSPGQIDSVLFSPACASFDQFENYVKRAEYFNSLVRNSD